MAVTAKRVLVFSVWQMVTGTDGKQTPYRVLTTSDSVAAWKERDQLAGFITQDEVFIRDGE